MHFAEGSGLSKMPTKAMPLRVFFRNFLCSLKVLLAILCRRFFKTKGFLLEFLTFLQAVPFWYFFLAVSSSCILHEGSLVTIIYTKFGYKFRTISDSF